VSEKYNLFYLKTKKQLFENKKPEVIKKNGSCNGHLPVAARFLNNVIRKH